MFGGLGYLEAPYMANFFETGDFFALGIKKITLFSAGSFSDNNYASLCASELFL